MEVAQLKKVLSKMSIAFESRNINRNKERVLTHLSIKDKRRNEIKIFSGENIDLLLLDVANDKVIDIELEKDSNLSLAMLAKNNINNVEINAKVGRNSHISLYFADFSFGNNKVKVTVDLNEERASCDWHLSSLSAKEDDKEFSIFINHNHPLTFARSDNYGVCKDKARLVFSGTSSIYKGNKKSETYQNAKIMVFDEDSIAVAKPILKIDENDLLASHSAVVGKINDEHLFYLTSRGLNEAQAKELITFGYLKPIIIGFNDDNIKNEIENLIEGKM